MKEGKKGKRKRPRGGAISRRRGKLAPKRRGAASKAPTSAATKSSNEALLRAALDSIAEGFVIYDAEDRFVLCNEAYRRLYAENAAMMMPGARYEDIMRTALAAGRYPDAKGREEDWLADWLQNHRQSDATAESQLKDGRWVLVSDRRMANGGIAGLRIDITVLKAAQASLRESQAQLRRGQEHLLQAQRVSHTGSLVVDLRTPDVVEFSQEMYHVLGLDPRLPPPSRDEFLAMLHPDDRPKYLALIKRAAQGLPVEPFDCRIIRADGSMRWLHNISGTVRDEEGLPIARIGTFTDVTEKRAAEMRQKELERSLRIANEAAEAARHSVEAANAELEQRVEARTQELRAAQEELLKTERLSALGQLTATVAHELRNPLSAIRNTVFTIREASGAGAAQFERPLTRMERSITRCENLIADLLAFSSPKDPKKELIALDLWLATLLDEQAMPEGVTLERRLATPAILVAIDPVQFKSVILNIIENAIQAIGIENERGGDRVTVTTAAADAIEIAIADTGPGIAADVLPKVFDPLFSTKGFGSGLGLSTVKQIIEQHGGTIWITSEPGQGAAVHIRLPPAEAQA